MNVRDKVVLITGASSGIGRELARQLGARGAKLVLVARRAEALQQLAVELAPQEVLVAPADVTNRQALQRVVDAALGRFGRIDIVVNNAGLGYFGPLAAMPMEQFDRVVQTNLHGLLHMTQLAVPALKQSKGMIVNVSSSLSKRALPFLAAYAGTKSMVDALSDGLRMELRPYGIRVLNYCPPSTDTGFAENAMRDPAMPPVNSNSHRMNKVTDVVADMVRAIEGEKREVVNGGGFLKLMNFLAPKVLDNMFYKAMVLKMTREQATP